jgi:hypothetical protein
MKKPLFTLGMLLFAGTASLFARGILKQSVVVIREAQAPQVQRCSVLEHEEYLESINPNRAQERMDYESTINTWIQNRANNPQVQGGTITIPVVVHVIWNTAAQNISDNQIFSQIQVLNEDFSRTNPDASNTPAAFQGVAANCDIQYCLATVDPNGNPTNGIERRQISTNVSFSTNDACKSFSTNGLNAWDVTQYLNMWVCNLGGGLLGYGEFPTGSPSNTFGLVMGYFCFGSNNTSYGTFSALTAPYDGGRTSTHEIGHCFNLFHIWGDDGNACTGSDQCADTPNQGDENYGCPAYPATASCSNGGDMSMNYMDYTNDDCMNLFTNNQKTRMLAVLNSNPYNALQTSTACQSASAGIDAGISAINSPATTICNTTFTPNVTIRNFGTNNLTSATINYRIDAGPIQTYNWTGNLASLTTQNVALSSMTTTAGTHTFTAYTTNPNSGVDANAANDQSQRTFTVNSTGQNLPYSEGFESTTFPQGGMTIFNNDGGTTWARTTVAAYTGSASAFMDNYDYNANGEIDEMILPNLNLSSVSNPVLTFQVAYRLYTDPTTNPNYSDTLRVWISTDCGVTWTSLYAKWGTTLTTVTPTYSTTEFVPTASQWRLENISLSPYQSSSNAIIKFRHATQYENNLHVDDINIMNATDAPGGMLHNEVNLFPNPTSGVVNVNVNLMTREDLNIKVTNSIGQVVSSVSETNTFGGNYLMDLTAEPNGVYFIEVQSGTEVVTRRIVISH